MRQPRGPVVIGQRVIALRMMAAGDVVVVIVIVVITVLVVVGGQLRFVTDLLGVGRRSYMVGSRPSQFLTRRITTAVSPALLGIGTAAGVMLARKWFVGDFPHAQRRRITD
jgi:hypothetical protein